MAVRKTAKGNLNVGLKKSGKMKKVILVDHLRIKKQKSVDQVKR